MVNYEDQVSAEDSERISAELTRTTQFPLCPARRCPPASARRPFPAMPGRLGIFMSGKHEDAGTSKRYLDWMKLWTSWLDDPKVQRLSEVDQRRYICILLLKRMNALQDFTKITDLAWRLHLSPEGEDDLPRTIKALEARGLIEIDDNGAIEIPTWHKRQGKDPDAARRQERSRNAKKQKGGPVTDVTPMSRDVTRCHNLSHDVTDVTPMSQVSPLVTTEERRGEEKRREERRREDTPIPPTGSPSEPDTTPDDPEVSGGKNCDLSQEEHEPAKKKAAGYEEAIEECIELFRKACEKCNEPMKPRLASGKVSLRAKFKRDAGPETCLQALRLAAERGWQSWLRHEGWFGLSWLCRTRTSNAAGRELVDHMEEILEGKYIRPLPPVQPRLKPVERDKWLEEFTGQPCGFGLLSDEELEKYPVKTAADDIREARARCSPEFNDALDRMLAQLEERKNGREGHESGKEEA